jgi:DNA-binding CsgD family transcriptional regulator
MKEGVTGFSPEGQFKQKLTDKIHNGLKCYEIVDGEITGMSLVPNPANEMKAKIISDNERIIGGVIIAPDKMIYRINPITGEQYYIYFTIEVIQILFEKYNEDISWKMVDRITLVNLYADGDKTIEEMATILKRDPEKVANRIIKEGEGFRDIVIVTMAKNGKTLNSIAMRLDISVEELKEIIKEKGGRIYKK